MDQYKPGDRDPSNGQRIYIRGLDLAIILRALYNRARPKFNGRSMSPGDVSLEEVREFLKLPENHVGVRYWKTRALRVSWDEERTWIDLSGFHHNNGIEEGLYAIEEVIRGYDRVVWTMTIVPK